MTTAHMTDAKLGDHANVYVCPPGHDYGWVSDLDYFTDADETITVTRQTWRLIAETEVTYYSSTELCPNCNGEGEPCMYCKGDGRHPLAGRIMTMTKGEL